MNRSVILSSAALLALAACGEAEKATNEVENAATEVASDTTEAVENTTAAATDAAPDDANTASGYATNAALSDMYEVEASRLALQKAKAPEVKKFAQMMVDDHTKTTNELKSLLETQAIPVTLPTALDGRRQGMITELQQASPTEFDTSYLDQQTRAHGEALDLHKSYADNGDNARLKAFAAKTAPIVQKHLDQVKRIDKSGADEPAANPPQK